MYGSPAATGVLKTGAAVVVVTPGLGAAVVVVTAGAFVVVGLPVVGGAGVVGAAVVVVVEPPLAFMNTTVTHSLLSDSRTAPIPTWVKSPRMLPRWEDEFMNALWIELTLGPTPTFSPRASHPEVTLPRFGL